jgi:glycosyltransferase involved in cell wall biosynthesis
MAKEHAQGQIKDWPVVTVVITTKNRKEDLCKCITSAFEQTAPLKVLVIDDGSTDGTFELVREKFPEVQIMRSEVSRGYIVQRNQAARLAQTPVIVSIDDDAVFSTPQVMEQILREFDHPRVGAVTIPMVNVNFSPKVLHRPPSSTGYYAIYSFMGTAHALLRELFLKLGGYREILVHQGEEEDYFIRMLNAGYISRAGRADPIHHFESPRRSWTRMDYFGARNKVLYAWHNVPFPYFPVHLTAATVRAATYTMKPGRLLTRLKGVVNAYAAIMAGRTAREPVAGNVYRVSRDLNKYGPLPLDEIEGELPAR